MGILTGQAIHDAVTMGHIKISPFDTAKLNPNSYNLTLGDTLMRYHTPYGSTLDSRSENKTIEYPPSRFHDGGWCLWPNALYLGHTVECAGSDRYVPKIETRSSFARLGLSCHLSAGYGDLGFFGQWVLEITVVEPLIIYPGQQLCQIEFVLTSGPIGWLYKGRYQGQHGPTASRIHQDHEVKS